MLGKDEIHREKAQPSRRLLIVMAGVSALFLLVIMYFMYQQLYQQEYVDEEWSRIVLMTPFVWLIITGVGWSYRFCAVHLSVQKREVVISQWARMTQRIPLGDILSLEAMDRTVVAQMGSESQSDSHRIPPMCSDELVRIVYKQGTVECVVLVASTSPEELIQIIDRAKNRLRELEL